MNENGIVGGILGWLKHPYNRDGSAFNWVMFVGLLIIAAFIWNMVLLHIKQE